jgi:hypothetical protein
MRETSFLSEAEMESIERTRDPEVIPHLLSTIRQQQHELDSLRLGLDVARRDREELRAALLAARGALETGTGSSREAAERPEESE